MPSAVEGRFAGDVRCFSAVHPDFQRAMRDGHLKCIVVRYDVRALDDSGKHWEAGENAFPWVRPPREVWGESCSLRNCDVGLEMEIRDEGAPTLTVAGKGETEQMADSPYPFTFSPEMFSRITLGRVSTLIVFGDETHPWSEESAELPKSRCYLEFPWVSGTRKCEYVTPDRAMEWLGIKATRSHLDAVVPLIGPESGALVGFRFSLQVLPFRSSSVYGQQRELVPVRAAWPHPARG